MVKLHGEASYMIEKSIKQTITGPYTAPLSQKTASTLYKILFSGLGGGSYWGVLRSDYESLYGTEKELQILEDYVEYRQNDIMGTMRTYAGKYRRLIFTFIWLMLVFQLIGLTFLYFKRLFVISILIAVFPIIMLFYCVDKMVDGKAQTFSLWFKELLANIFIQSVHAVIYVLLVELGLNIYKNDPGNWILLVAGMFMILPAEKIMKEVFDLNGMTLGRIGGSFMNLALAIGTAKTFLTAGRSKNDKSMEDKNNKRTERTQKKQDREDKKAETRAAKRAGKDKNYTEDGRYVEKLNAYERHQEKAYERGTRAREAKVKYSHHLDEAGRIARNATATTVGLMYGVAGGDLESMAQGAQIAKGLSGKTKNIDESEFELKTELKSAYRRRQ